MADRQTRAAAVLAAAGVLRAAGDSAYLPDVDDALTAALRVLAAGPARWPDTLPIVPCTGCGNTDRSAHVAGERKCCPDCDHPEPQRVSLEQREHLARAFLAAVVGAANVEHHVTRAERWPEAGPSRFWLEALERADAALAALGVSVR